MKLEIVFETHGYLDEADKWIGSRMLCFTCAVRLIVAGTRIDSFIRDADVAGEDNRCAVCFR